MVTFIFFLGEYVLFHLFGRWFKPNLLILLIIFFNIILGTRFGLFVAVLAGLIKDCFSTAEFGLYLFSFIICAYGLAIIKRYFYQLDSSFFRLLIAFALSLTHALVVYGLGFLSDGVDFYAAVIFVILPEVLATVLVARYIFNKLQTCVLKFSV
jgi:rod shape-determining protein MreD